MTDARPALPAASAHDHDADLRRQLEQLGAQQQRLFRQLASGEKHFKQLARSVWRVQEDERDREIEKRAAGWGRGALIACIVGLALMLAFSPAERLAWATHFMIANLLVFALMWGWLCEYVATALMYWKDRRL